MCSNPPLHLSKIIQQLTLYSQNKINFIIMVFLRHNKIIFENNKIFMKKNVKNDVFKAHIRYLNNQRYINKIKSILKLWFFENKKK